MNVHRKLKNVCQYRDIVFGLWTLPNIQPRRCFEDQILPANCAENLGSWSGSSPTRPRIHHLRSCCHHMLVTVSLLFHEKTLFKGFLELSRQVSRKVVVTKMPLCLTLYFGRNNCTLLPRLARLLTSPSPLKHLVLKFPIKPYEGTLLMIGMLHPISSVFRLIWRHVWKTDPRLETERLDIWSFVVGSNKSLASQSRCQR